jgi:DNA-binding response OmpR family regulator/anti-sigma regulatory factor (Ser/Thr protein kinase)
MNQLINVLIVDDEPLGRETLAALLSPLGYQQRFAANGAEALQLAMAVPPDLILLDVMMPGMDGFQVCQKLRAHASLADVPVIMLTALDDRESRLRGIEAGADDFVSKPFDRVELRARVKTITRLNRYRRLVNERAKFEWVVEQSDDGYLVVEQSGAISYANPRARFYLGAPLAGELAGTFLDLALSQYRLEPGGGWDEWFGALAHEHSSPRVLVRPASDTADIFMLHVALLEMTPDPGPRCLVRLRDATESLVGQHTVWSFQALIRHKLSTSLAQMVGGLRLIESMDLAPAEGMLAEILKIVSHGANSLQSEVNDIFQYIDSPDLVRAERSYCTLDELPALIADLKASFQIEALQLHSDIGQDPSSGAVAISRQGLRLIFGELLENARKFHPHRAPAIEISIARHDHEVAIHVRDDGVRLAPSQLERAWLPYYQGERYFTGQVPGMGLGLPMVAGLVWRVGGTCRISNREPGPGIDVEIRIPSVEPI